MCSPMTGWSNRVVERAASGMALQHGEAFSVLSVARKQYWVDMVKRRIEWRVN